MPDDWREQIARRSSPPLGLPHSGGEGGLLLWTRMVFYVTPPLGFGGRVSRFVALGYRKPCRAGLSVTDFCTDFGFAGELQYLYNGMCGSMQS